MEVEEGHRKMVMVLDCSYAHAILFRQENNGSDVSITDISDLVSYFSVIIKNVAVIAEGLHFGYKLGAVQPDTLSS